jgi:hypothetical protein
MKAPPGKEDEWKELYGPFPERGAEMALYDVIYGDGAGWPEEKRANLFVQLLRWQMKINPTGR